MIAIQQVAVTGGEDAPVPPVSEPEKIPPEPPVHDPGPDEPLPEGDPFPKEPPEHDPQPPKPPVRAAR